MEPTFSKLAGGGGPEEAPGLLFAAVRFGPVRGRDEVAFGGKGLLFRSRKIVVGVGGDRHG
jgi:hypothetical protein